MGSFLDDPLERQRRLVQLQQNQISNALAQQAMLGVRPSSLQGVNPTGLQGYEKQTETKPVITYKTYREQLQAEIDTWLDD